MTLRQELTALSRKAKEAANALLGLSSEKKNSVLKAMASAILDKQAEILRENKKDLQRAKARKIQPAFIERLSLNERRIQEMSDSLGELVNLADPVNEVIKAWRRPNGLWIHKVRVPIGVVAIIYESRPNVTSDCIGLCFKAGNSVILKGGSDALNSNLAIYKILSGVLAAEGIARGAVSFVAAGGHQAVQELLRLERYIDVAIPRGGEALIRQVAQTSRIPVIKHYKGVCHVYVDEWADLNMAEKICLNAKLQRPATCNAMESLLVHRDIAVRFLPGMLKKFRSLGVQLRGCPLSKKICRGLKIKNATSQDYYSEYLGLILSVKVIAGLSEAIAHINHYGSHHSDSIITENYDHALRFLREVDSACVYANASTRFTDGYQFGLGAEIGISTDKLHARGPMALEELTTYKYMVFGSGQIRQ